MLCRGPGTGQKGFIRAELVRVEGKARVPATLQTDYLITDPGEVWGAEGDVGE